MNKYIVFFILVISQYIMDRSTSNCNTYKGEFLLFIHHIYAIYLYTGAFFFDPFIHLIVVISTLFHWYIYKKCILTEYTNIYCGVDINRPFNDYIRMLKIYKLNKYIHWILLFMLLCYDLCLII
jgi:hypothetical protein